MAKETDGHHEQLQLRHVLRCAGATSHAKRHELILLRGARAVAGVQATLFLKEALGTVFLRAIPILWTMAEPEIVDQDLSTGTRSAGHFTAPTPTAPRRCSGRRTKGHLPPL